MISSAPDSASNRSGHHSTIVIALLEFEEIYGGYWRDKQPQLWFFIDTDVEMV